MDGLSLTAGVVCALFCAACGLLLKKSNPEYALLLSLAGCGLLLFSALPGVRELINLFSSLCPDGEAGEILQILYRCAGITVLSRMGAELCRDAGQGSLSLGVELLGGVGVLLCALPVFTLLAALLREMGT